MSADKPLTPRELARLLRAFAHLIESTTDEPPADAPAPRQRRRRKRAADAPEVSDLTKERARRALRRIGVLP